MMVAWSVLCVVCVRVCVSMLSPYSFLVSSLGHANKTFYSSGFDVIKSERVCLCYFLCVCM